MTKDEALKMAIEFMETLTIDVGIKTWNEKHRKEAIQACKEALQQRDLYSEIKEGFDALKQPAQEPVAEVDFSLEYDCALVIDRSKVTDGQKLYIHPAPSWQGLSDDEIEEIVGEDVDVMYSGDYEAYRAIEQALKEKNHG